VGRDTVPLGEQHEGKTGEEVAQRGSELPGATKRGESQESPKTGTTPAKSGPEPSAGSNENRQTTPANLHSTVDIGLNDEELETWAKNKSFRVEPAGEQLGMFGVSDKVFRVFRTVGKNVQTGLVYENQLDRAGISKEGPQQGKLGLAVDENAPKPWESEGQSSLFRGESGEFEPGKIADAAVKSGSAIGNFLREERENIAQSRKLQSGMYDLESQYTADVLRAAQKMKAVVTELGGNQKAAKDLEAVYHHLEDPTIDLSPEQDHILDV
jgi:hypothetical protein